MCACMFLYGLFNFGVAIAYAVAGELHANACAGLSIAFTNMLSIVIGASLQPLKKVNMGRISSFGKSKSWTHGRGK